jgi:tRNA (guanine-N7-)-methyltransferase
MGKDKLRKFAENLTFSNLVQPEFDQIFRRDHPLKGLWRDDFFKNNNPLVLELGCGKGEYTVGLGAAHPERNHLGVDIKGARMWRGAKTATEMGLTNVGFLRTRIEFIGSFFGPGEVSEIWITFPDPQLRKGREKKRLTSPVFLEYYARFLSPGGVIHLKTDSRELHDYTRRVIATNNLPLHAASTDIYATSRPGDKETGRPNNTDNAVPTGTPPNDAPLSDAVLSLKTTYERRFLDEGKPITYLRFGLGPHSDFTMVYDD